MRAALGLLFGLLTALPAQAQSKLLQAHATAAPAYTGAGDIVASAKVAYALRGYSAAYAATGTGKSTNVRRASDNATQDIVILTTGSFDVASYNTFVGTDATASCTLAAGSAACSGASATLHIHDVVTGVGLTQPCVVTATNGSTTATLVLAGTATTCGTVGVAETMTFQVAGNAPTVYDQSGALNCTGAACNASQATAANQPQILPVCTANGAPCLFFDKSLPSLVVAGTSTTTGPISINFEGGRFSGTTAQFAYTCGGGGAIIFFNTANSLIYNDGTNTAVATASEGIVHAIQGVGGSGTSGSLTVDGSSRSSLRGPT